MPRLLQAIGCWKIVEGIEDTPELLKGLFLADDIKNNKER
jgi:hypothetical protein